MSFYRVNARLYFNEYSSTVFDPLNNFPEKSESLIPVEVSIEQSGDVESERLVGVDETRRYYSGKCINPRQLTDEQRKAGKVRIEIEIGDTSYSGNFEFLPVSSARIDTVNKFFGEKIEGFLSLDN